MAVLTDYSIIRKVIMNTLKNFFHGNNGQALQKIAEKLWDHNYDCFLAGGCVRDLLLGRPFKDIDVVTNATPDQVIELFPQHIPVGKKFGIIVVLQDGFSFEVATFRTDGEYVDGRHPDSVQFASPLEDAKRRDFTINALFYDLKNNKILDFVNGEQDLNRKLIRAVGVPQKRFQEDYLRILRAIRFQAQLDFTIEKETWGALIAEVPFLKKISGERIAQELQKGTQANAKLFLQQLQASGAWQVIFSFINDYGWENSECNSLSSGNASKTSNSIINNKILIRSDSLNLGSALALLFLQSQVKHCVDAFVLESPEEIKWQAPYLKFIRDTSLLLKPSAQDEKNLKFLAALPCWAKYWEQLRLGFQYEILHQWQNTFFAELLTDFLKAGYFSDKTIPDKVKSNILHKTIHDKTISENTNQNLLQMKTKPTCYLTGEDVLILPPQYRGACLKEALYLQWEGKLNSREESLNWFKEYVKLKK